MSKRPPGTQTPATQDEIEQALASLTEAQLVRLNESAAFRHRSLGARGAGRHETDILSDAIIAVLEGRRKWIRSSVDFVPFILGVMKSLASHIRTGKARDAFDETASNPVRDEDDDADFVEQIPTPAPVDPERQVLARDLDRQIRERFRDDPVALLVYESFLQKMTPAEIQSCLGIDEKEYNAAAKRLRRAVRSLAVGGPR
jgi:DNA-directed RNA polymerase specialized sigma24 family protein